MYTHTILISNYVSSSLSDIIFACGVPFQICFQFKPVLAFWIFVWLWQEGQEGHPAGSLSIAFECGTRKLRTTVLCWVTRGDSHRLPKVWCPCKKYGMCLYISFSELCICLYIFCWQLYDILWKALNSALQIKPCARSTRMSGTHAWRWCRSGWTAGSLTARAEG